MKLLDWAIIIILFFCLAFALVFYYHSAIDECTRSPLVYGAKQLENTYNKEFLGYGMFVGDYNFGVMFNSENISIKRK